MPRRAICTRDIQAAESVFAIGHACGAHRVGDCDQPIALGVCDDAQRKVSKMNAIGDDFSRQTPIGERVFSQAVFAMMEVAHRVEQMRDDGGAGRYCRLSFFSSAVRMANRHDNTSLSEATNGIECAWKFWCNGDEFEDAWRGGKQSIDVSGAGVSQCPRILSTAVAKRKEWTLEVHTCDRSRTHDATKRRQQSHLVMNWRTYEACEHRGGAMTAMELSS